MKIKIFQCKRCNNHFHGPINMNFECLQCGNKNTGSYCHVLSKHDPGSEGFCYWEVEVVDETIEQKVDRFNPFMCTNNIGSVIDWKWRGKPETKMHPPVLEGLHEMEEVIKQGDPVECLTSKSEYIRECKKWHMENE